MRRLGGSQLSDYARHLANDAIKKLSENLEALVEKPLVDFSALSITPDVDFRDVGELALPPLLKVIGDDKARLVDRYSALLVYAEAARQNSTFDSPNEYARDQLRKALVPYYKALLAESRMQMERFQSQGYIESRPVTVSQDKVEELLLANGINRQEFLLLQGYRFLAGLDPYCDVLESNLGNLLKALMEYRMIAGGVDEHVSFSLYFDRVEHELFRAIAVMRGDELPRKLSRLLRGLHSNVPPPTLENDKGAAIPTSMSTNYLLVAAKFLVGQPNYHRRILGYLTEHATLTMDQAVRQRFQRWKSLPLSVTEDITSLYAYRLELAANLDNWGKLEGTAFGRFQSEVNQFLENSGKAPWDEYGRFKSRVLLHAIEQAQISGEEHAIAIDWAYQIVRKAIQDFEVAFAQQQARKINLLQRTMVEHHLFELLESLRRTPELNHPELLGLIVKVSHLPSVDANTRKLAADTVKWLRRDLRN